MKNHWSSPSTLLGLVVVGLVLISLAVYHLTSSTKIVAVPTELSKFDSGQLKIITLAGGCFWCTEAFFQEAPGVIDAVSGYAGGDASTATYKAVSKGTTDHREAVQVTYDPGQISTKEILDIYWGHIDPTDTKGQFADQGFQYTTAIYYHDEEQRLVAEASKKALGESGLFKEPIASQILPYTTFFPAEEYHQDYYQKSSDHYERYKKGSGRADFIEENWAKDAALQFLAEEESKVSMEKVVYAPHAFTTAEIEAGLKLLSLEAYKVLAQEGTEPPYKNAYWDNKVAGIYVDLVTGRPLFSSTHKYDSGTGWPSFYQPLAGADLELVTDSKLLYSRVEVRSESGHLGHVFDDGPAEYGGKRYCMNSSALKFISKTEMKKLGYDAYLYLFPSD